MTLPLNRFDVEELLQAVHAQRAAEPGCADPAERSARVERDAVDVDLTGVDPALNTTIHTARCPIR